MSLWLASSAHAAPLIDLQAGDMRFVHSGGRNTVLTVRGVDVFRESGLYIVTPEWKRALLNLDKARPQVKTFEENGAKVAIAYYSAAEAKARFRYEMRPGSFSAAVTYSTTVQPAWVEYDAAYVNANIISGQPFEAQTVEGPCKGIAAAFTDVADQVKSRVCPFFTTATFDSRIGPMTISVEGNTPETSNLNMFDARGITLEWGAKNPIFWLGLGSPERNVPPGDNTVTVTWTFGKQDERSTVVPATVKVVDVENAVPVERELAVIPRPKQMKASAGKAVRLTEGTTRILLDEDASPEERAAADELQAELREMWGTEILVATPGMTDIAGCIIISVNRQSGPIPEQFKSALSHREGYVLKAERGAVAIVGSDPRGAYYGAQTLKQLIQRDEKGAYISPIEILDWPTMAFRGVHWFGGPNSWPFHERMLDCIAAPLKLNRMVYECEYSQWTSQPKIWNPQRSTPLDQVRKSVAYARAHFIEPIPLFPLLGHTDWLFQNGANLAFSADRKTGHAYDPTLDETYKAVFGVMQEAIDIFQPKWFHIGHDEVTTFGEHIPPEKVTEYFVNDIAKIHGWLKAKGIGTMVWGDELLHSSETPSSGNAFTLDDAKARRKGLPKDVVVADWHYRGDAEYPSVDIFQKGGHQVIGCTWSKPINIRNFSKALAEKKAWGLLQTTWDGYAMSVDRVTGSSLEQYSAYVLAAEYAWNGGEPRLGRLGYNAHDAFLKFWERQPSTNIPQPGFRVVFREPSAQPSPGGKGSRTPPPPGEAGRGQLDRVSLAGILDPLVRQASLSIPLDSRKASQLRFVWGTDFSAPVGTKVATLNVEFADGTSAQRPITYGREIAAFNDLRIRPGTTGVWYGESQAGELRERRAWTWTNPNPSKALKSIEITSANTEAAPVLCDITGTN